MTFDFFIVLFHSKRLKTIKIPRFGLTQFSFNFYTSFKKAIFNLLLRVSTRLRQPMKWKQPQPIFFCALWCGDFQGKYKQFQNNKKYTNFTFFHAKLNLNFTSSSSSSSWHERHQKEEQVSLNGVKKREKNSWLELKMTLIRFSTWEMSERNNFPLFHLYQSSIWLT